ncbi:hypothetical protein HAX54_005083, partial [Datura stramonium]|nr:hypothetical protein [Datura stramonium]
MVEGNQSSLQSYQGELIEKILWVTLKELSTKIKGIDLHTFSRASHEAYKKESEDLERV